MKNNIKRILLTMVAAILLVVMSVAGTLAYLTSTSQEVKNTFTVGDVNIILDEAQVTGDGQNWTEKGHDNRVLENTYKLQPGLTYKKDPTVTVVTGSEDCYVRMQVTVNDYSKLQNAFPDAEWWNGDIFLLEKLVLGWDKATWIPQPMTASKDDTSVTYEFWYKEEVTADTTDNNKNIDGIQLPDLFTDIKMPDNMTNTELAFLKNMKINVIAHAIQSEGLTMEQAWAAWVTTGADNIMAPTQPDGTTTEGEGDSDTGNTDGNA